MATPITEVRQDGDGLRRRFDAAREGEGTDLVGNDIRITVELQGIRAD